MNKILIAVNPFITDTSKYKDCEFIINPWGGEPTADLIEAELSKNAYDGLIVGTKKVKNIIAQECPTLRVISRVGAGIDNIDIDHFKKNGVATAYTPYGPTDSTAEQALALILAGLKRIPQYHSEMKNQKWNRKMGRRLKDCTVGIIGTGRIGKRTAELLMPFECRIILYDKQPDSKISIMTNAQYVSKEEILRQSDVITFHIAYSESTKNWLTKKELNEVRKDIIIANAARGGIINEDDIYEFLKHNKDAMYCADVYRDEPYSGLLSSLENTILTPHVSTFTYGARVTTEEQALNNCMQILRGEKCENVL